MPIELRNCKYCKSNDVPQVKIPASRKPYCCSYCWEATRRYDEPTFEEIMETYQTKKGKHWYDDWPLED
jgi:hypothetical protein